MPLTFTSNDKQKTILFAKLFPIWSCRFEIANSFNTVKMNRTVYTKRLTFAILYYNLETLSTITKQNLRHIRSNEFNYLFHLQTLKIAHFHSYRTIQNVFRGRYYRSIATTSMIQRPNKLVRLVTSLSTNETALYWFILIFKISVIMVFKFNCISFCKSSRNTYPTRSLIQIWGRLFNQ